MKRFRFGLQRVLELREYAEREAEIELGKAVGALTLIEQRIAAVAEDRFDAAAKRFAPGNGLAEMQNYDRYILRLDQTRDKLLMDAARAELVVAEKRDIFLEASRERKVLDKIKDKRKAEYRKFAQAEENKELDDIAARMTRTQ
ncbi:flagellar export protein FliJ [Treponema primitia]|uniref:flagellar export protein FliJ n=1 Tax=Treponema primitia TaxID=88058 RepID=UPI0002555234|nr:flagellar export protein FliJ [Treponema primitia]